MRKFITLYLCLVLNLFGTFAEAGNWNFNVNLETPFVTGVNAYEIRFAEFDPFFGLIEGKSLLEFDILNTFLNVGFTAAYKDFFSINLVLGTAIIKYDGNLRDRDWFYNDSLNVAFDPLMGDTDSDIESDGDFVDLRITWGFPKMGKGKKIQLNGSVGYLAQNWGRYTTKNVEGVYSGLLGDGSSFDLVFDDVILTYDVEFRIPYIGVGLDLKFKNTWLIRFNFDVSPLAKATDRDNHVLREKISKGDADGVYVNLQGQMDWNFFKRMHLALNLKYLHIVTDGTETQVFSDGLTFDVDDEISSSQFYFGLKVILFFG